MNNIKLENAFTDQIKRQTVERVRSPTDVLLTQMDDNCHK